MISALHKLRQHLLTGVSYAIPFIACGGILIACGHYSLAVPTMFPSGFATVTVFTNGVPSEAAIVLVVKIIFTPAGLLHAQVGVRGVVFTAWV